MCAARRDDRYRYRFLLLLGCLAYLARRARRFVGIRNPSGQRIAHTAARLMIRIPTTMDDREALLAFRFGLRFLLHLVAGDFALTLTHGAPRLLIKATLMHLGGFMHPRALVLVLL